MIADPGKGLTAEGAKVAEMQEQKPSADQRGGSRIEEKLPKKKRRERMPLPLLIR
jgi:hypothetical protein